MKKLIFPFIAIAMLSFGSCKKCQDCHYDANGTEVEIGELCGDDLENAEANGYTVGDTIVTIHCEEH